MQAIMGFKFQLIMHVVLKIEVYLETYSITFTQNQFFLLLLQKFFFYNISNKNRSAASIWKAQITIFFLHIILKSKSMTLIIYTLFLFLKSLLRS